MTGTKLEETNTVMFEEATVQMIVPQCCYFCEEAFGGERPS